jgi:hypothetical protein
VWRIWRRVWNRVVRMPWNRVGRNVWRSCRRVWSRAGRIWDYNVLVPVIARARVGDRAGARRRGWIYVWLRRRGWRLWRRDWINGWRIWRRVWTRIGRI